MKVVLYPKNKQTQYYYTQEETYQVPKGEYDKIRTIKEQVKNDYYSRPSVIQRIAEILGIGKGINK